MTQEELNKILENHKKWLNAEDGGIRANLSYANLRATNLSNANLRNANLSYADLTYANLTYADLSYADLTYANLTYADLSYADLTYANLTYADLSYANLRGAIGNNKEVKTLQLGKYDITILVGIKIDIGCQNHTITKWANFTDEEISKMDDGALEWWKEWKEVILKVAKENK